MSKRRLCMCTNYPEHSGEHWISQRQYFRHLERGRRLEYPVNEQHSEEERHIETETDDANLRPGSSEEETFGSEIYTDFEGFSDSDLEIRSEEEEEDSQGNEDEDIFNVENWSEGADGSQNVFGNVELNPGDGSGTPDHPNDSEDDDTDDAELPDKNNLLLYIHLHQLYRRIGRLAWKMLRDLSVAIIGDLLGIFKTLSSAFPLTKNA